MVGPTSSVRVSSAQSTYLLNADYLPSDLRGVVAAATRSNGMTFEVHGDVAERFRSALTERLAQVGFDRDYKPTGEGAMLEDLIDVFEGAA